ncbi:hypothetical protein ACLOJK_007866, partial [Asimina triloba]
LTPSPVASRRNVLSLQAREEKAGRIWRRPPSPDLAVFLALTFSISQPPSSPTRSFSSSLSSRSRSHLLLRRHLPSEFSLLLSRCLCFPPPYPSPSSLFPISRFHPPSLTLSLFATSLFVFLLSVPDLAATALARSIFLPDLPLHHLLHRHHFLPDLLLSQYPFLLIFRSFATLNLPSVVALPSVTATHTGVRLLALLLASTQGRHARNPVLHR